MVNKQLNSRFPKRNFAGSSIVTFTTDFSPATGSAGVLESVLASIPPRSFFLGIFVARHSLLALPLPIFRQARFTSVLMLTTGPLSKTYPCSASAHGN